MLSFALGKSIQPGILLVLLQQKDGSSAQLDKYCTAADHLSLRRFLVSTLQMLQSLQDRNCQQDRYHLSSHQLVNHEQLPQYRKSQLCTHHWEL